MTLNELKELERKAYEHLQDFYADEDEEFEMAKQEWLKIVKQIMNYK